MQPRLLKAWLLSGCAALLLHPGVLLGGTVLVDAGNRVFADDFETGFTTAWSGAVGEI